MLQQIKINGSKKWKFKLFVYLEKKLKNLLNFSQFLDTLNIKMGKIGMC